MKHLNGKLGNLPAEVIIADDQQNPMSPRPRPTNSQEGKGRLHDRHRLLQHHAGRRTAGVREQDLLHLGQRRPLAVRRRAVQPFFFNVAWQNDNLHEAMGKYVQDKGFRNVVIVTPNYPGGKDAVSGFKRYYKGRAEEIYTKLGQLDYAANWRRSEPRSRCAVLFLPGGMGINFVKQFVAAGLSKDIQLFAPGFGRRGRDQGGRHADARHVQFLALGARFRQPREQALRRRFRKEYGRLPSLYASQGYDAALLMDAAVRDVKGQARRQGRAAEGAGSQTLQVGPR